MARKTTKPAPKPTPRPLPRSRASQLDLVRNPNFDAAMAQQDYANLMRDQRARLAAGQGTQPAGNQDFIDSRDPNKMYTQDMVDYIDPATGERTSRTRGVVPTPGSRFVPANQAGLYNELQRNQNPIGGLGGQQSTNSTAGYVQVDPMAGMQNNPSIYDSLRPDYSQVGTVPMRSPQNPNQMNFGQIAQGIGRLMPQIPQGQQQGARADQYQNFLQQGLANYAAQNYPQQQQGAMGAQAAQNYAGGPMPSPAIPSRKPIGGVTAQPRGLPRPRQPKGFRIPIGRSAF